MRCFCFFLFVSGHEALSRGEILDLFKEEAEKAHPLFKKFADMASQKGVRAFFSVN